jgi:predicted permease
LIGTFLIESALIAMMGGVLGIILAKESIPFMLWLMPENLPHTAPIAIDGRVVLFAVAISALTSLLFGLAPALKMSRANLNKLLRQSSYGASAGPQQTRTGRVLVSAQSALTLILLAGSIMLLRSFLTLHAVPPGFDSQHVWVAQVSLAANRYQTTTASTRLLRQICTQIRDYPGVEAVATVTGLPLEQGLNLPIYADEKGKDTPEYAEVRIVSADYFRVMRIPVLAGRSFANGDAAGSAPAVIINETLARRWWPGQSSLGHFVTASSMAGSAISDLPRQIVGVVADMREAGLGVPPRPTIFVPLDQTPDSISAVVNKPIPASIVIRASKGAMDLSEYLHTVLNTADPDLSIASWRPLADVVSTSLAAPRFYASVTTAFGIFALLLTAIGLYGLLSYQLVLRTREIAVRVALGARRSRVIVLIVRQGIQLVAFGAALGMACVPLLARLLGTMLYNLSGVTFGVLAGATLLLVAVAALTSLLTAARAAAIDPIVALRTE